MTIKKKIPKIIFVALAAFSALFIAIYLTGWDIHSSLYSFVWDYQFLRIYALISISTLGLLNVFGLIQFLINKDKLALGASNSGGVYGYLIGTVVYFLFFVLVRDYSLRAFALTIPIVTTALGFNYFKINGDGFKTRTGLILIVNIVIMIFLLVVGYNLYLHLDYGLMGLDFEEEFIPDYLEMISILTVGIVCVLLLNIIYLIYLRKD